MVTMSAVWDRTTEFLSDNVAAVLGIAGLAIYLPTVVQEILQPLNATAGPGAKAGLGLAGAALTFVAVWGQTALIALVLDPALGRNGAFARGTARFGPMVAVGLVLLVAFLALMIPPIALMAIDGVDFDAMAAGTGAMPNLSPGTALVIVLYCLLLVALLAWVGARLSVVSAVVVGERRGLGAIARAFALTKGFAGKILGVLILFGIVAIVATLAAKTVFGSVFRIVLGGDGAITAASVLTALITALVSTAFSVVTAAFLTKLYVALGGRTAASPATA